MGSFGATATQTMKRIPRIKFPKRHPHPHPHHSQPQPSVGSTSQPPATSATEGTFFAKSNASASMGGKASLQPKRTIVSEEEIEAILMGGTF